MVTRVYTERMFPLSRALHAADTGRSELLSLLEATTANFSVTGAMWFLERPSDDDFTPDDLKVRLREALIATLEAYPQWCGHLKLVAYRPDQGMALGNRFGRLQLCYQSPHDPGVELVTAESSISLDSLMSNDQCHVAYKDMHQIPLDGFTPPTELAAPCQDDEQAIKPSVAIQLTGLSC